MRRRVDRVDKDSDDSPQISRRSFTRRLGRGVIIGGIGVCGIGGLFGLMKYHRREGIKASAEDENGERIILIAKKENYGKVFTMHDYLQEEFVRYEKSPAGREETLWRDKIKEYKKIGYGESIPNFQTRRGLESIVKTFSEKEDSVDVRVNAVGKYPVDFDCFRLENGHPEEYIKTLFFELTGKLYEDNISLDSGNKIIRQSGGEYLGNLSAAAYQAGQKAAYRQKNKLLRDAAAYNFSVAAMASIDDEEIRERALAYLAEYQRDKAQESFRAGSRLKYDAIVYADAALSKFRLSGSNIGSSFNFLVQAEDTGELSEIIEENRSKLLELDERREGRQFQNLEREIESMRYK